MMPSAAANESGATFPKRPYPGLRPYNESEWPVFFGREIMVEEVIGRVLQSGFVVIHGSSGCGKSSLVAAGVLPQLKRRWGRQRGARSVRTEEVRPGQSPMRALAEKIARLVDPQGSPAGAEEIHKLLARRTDLRSELADRMAKAGIVQACILIDQFEELFRFGTDVSADEARLFAEVVVELANRPDTEEAAAGDDEASRQRPGLSTIITIRSEFLGDCARYPGLAEVINRAQYLLPNMSKDDMLRAISEPALLFGGAVEGSLARYLVADAMRERDPLPLLQHALMRLWDQAGSYLRLNDYATAIAGMSNQRNVGMTTGLSYLLGMHAEEVLAEVTKDEPAAMEIVEHIFRALTTIDVQGRAIRRPQTFESLGNVANTDDSELRRVLDAFRNDGISFLAPFMVDDRKLEPGEMIDISHEALIRAWPRIADRTPDRETGRINGWLHREFQDGLIWRALAVQSQVFSKNLNAILEPATTEQRWNWFSQFRQRPAWALRYLIDKHELKTPEEQPEWLAVTQLMEASYQHWQKKVIELKQEKERRQQAEATAKRRKRLILLGWAPAATVFLFGTLGFATFSFRSLENARQNAENALQNAKDARLERDEAVAQERLARAQEQLTRAQANVLVKQRDAFASNANELQQQIDALKAALKDAQASKSKLREQVDSVVSSLQSQVATLDAASEPKLCQPSSTDLQPIPSGTTGYLWIGSVEQSRLTGLDCKWRIAPTVMQPGDRYVLATPTLLRSGLPDETYKSAPAIGALADGSMVQIIDKPTAYLRSSGVVQYWVHVVVNPGAN